MSIATIEKEAEWIATIATAFAFPVVLLTQLIVTGKPTMAMGGAIATFYYLYDGSADGLLRAYTAAGIVFAVTDRTVLQQGAEDAYDLGKTWEQKEEAAEKEKLCKEYPWLGAMLKWKC